MGSPVVFGAHLRPMRDFASWEEIQNATEQALYRALDIGNVTAFAGAGMSRDFGYPLWPKLVEDVLDSVYERAVPKKGYKEKTVFRRSKKD